MCERTGEVASYVVARYTYYEVEKGENHEMVEGTSWMVRWKAGGKAVSTDAQSRRGSKSSSSERASGNSHPCPIQPYYPNDKQKSLSEALDSIFQGAHTPKGIAEPVRKFLRSILIFQLFSP